MRNWFIGLAGVACLAGGLGVRVAVAAPKEKVEDVRSGRQHTLLFSGARLKGTPERMKPTEFETFFKENLVKVKTIYPDEIETEFEGVSLPELVRKLGEPGVKRVRFSAVDRYSQILSVSEISMFEGILAFKKKGQLIPTRERGSFRVIFQYGKMEPSAVQLWQAKSVYSVSQIEFLKD